MPCEYHPGMGNAVECMQPSLLRAMERSTGFERDEIEALVCQEGSEGCRQKDCPGYLEILMYGIASRHAGRKLPGSNGHRT